MEKQKLPNSTLILVFGIISIITCCCYGVIGLIFGVIALILANKAIKLYKEAPESYDGYSNVSTGRVLAIIGIILNVIYLGTTIYFWVTLGSEGILEWQQELLEQYGG